MMDNEKYYSAFKSLGITVDPLPLNYTPEIYGRKLFSMLHPNNDVSYQASTDYVEVAQKADSSSVKK